MESRPDPLQAEHRPELVEDMDALSCDVKAHIQKVHLHTITSEAELYPLREDWSTVLDHPNTDMDFYLSIIGNRKQVIRPHVVTISYEEKILAIVAARLEEAEFKLRLGYRVIAKPKLKTLRVVHGNNFETMPAEIQHALLDQLLEVLDRKQAEILTFDSLVFGSVVGQAIKSRVSPWLRKSFISYSPHWQIEAADNFDAYMLGLSRTTRKGLRRRIRKLEDSFSESLTIKRLSQENDFETMLNDIEKVSKKTYQDSIDKGFSNNQETRQSMLLAFRAGKLSSLVAYVDGEAVAFDNARCYGRTLYLENSGYDPAYAEDGLGTYLLLKQIEMVHERDDIDTIDFGFGDSSYKSSLCNTCWDEYSTYVFARGFKGVLLNIFTMSVVGTHNICSKLLKKLGIFEKIRNASRRRIK